MTRGNGGNDPVELSKEAACYKETDKALCVVAVDFQPEPFWIPKSCIHDNSECYKKGTSGTIVVKYWFALKQGWTL